MCSGLKGLAAEGEEQSHENVPEIFAGYFSSSKSMQSMILQKTCHSNLNNAE